VAMLQGRALAEISLMHTVAEQTVWGWEQRKNG
jgi:hypothetical protein